MCIFRMEYAHFSLLFLFALESLQFPIMDPRHRVKFISIAELQLNKSQYNRLEKLLHNGCCVAEREKKNVRDRISFAIQFRFPRWQQR